jgi:hypothetical protein
MIFVPISIILALCCRLVRGYSEYASYPETEKEFLQRLVTWDSHSFFVRGERLMLYSGEFHPFRLPVPGLWLDIFQKIKALGFNTVSFYTYWGLIEGKQGRIVNEGIWSLDEFFRAASEAGVYLIARPGPYINAETAAGGFPGWLLKKGSVLRSNDTDFLDATSGYVAKVGEAIANAQITRGGPVILVQAENEYSSWPGISPDAFPSQMNREYIGHVNQQFRNAGIVVPLVSNDPAVKGYFAPGTGLGEVDVYGIDAYPLRYDCAHPSVWPTYRFPRDWQTLHRQQSPTTPFAVLEYQGGSATSWGGVDQEECGALVNAEAVRVLHKQLFSFGVKLLNVYMLFGGTNWGNLGFMGGDSSYDYGAAIAETRHVKREKYSEMKLQANFLKVSPAYHTAEPGAAVNGSFAGTAELSVTPVFDTQSDTKFYVVRHADFTSMSTTNYRLNVFCSLGNVSIPQLAGQLTLNGRDSKIHVTDYDIGGIALRYSTADILTWAVAEAGNTTLILYGGIGEVSKNCSSYKQVADTIKWHEFAVSKSLGQPVLPTNDSTVQLGNVPPVWIIKWQVTATRKIVRFEQGQLQVHLICRNAAYSHWTIELPARSPIANYSSPSKASIIVQGGYLMRTADISGNELRLHGDINATTGIELIHEPTGSITNITFDGTPLNTTRSSDGFLKAKVDWTRPAAYSLPDFRDLTWRHVNSLPEVNIKSYDDSKWTICNHNTSTTPMKLHTPTSLYASDYGFHTGSLIYRGRFAANGNESWVLLTSSGGWGYGHSVWINSTFLGSWVGSIRDKVYTHNLTISPFLQPDGKYVITVLIDHMGQDEEAPGTDAIKEPLGLVNYAFDTHPQSDITWKITGNIGGEDYVDIVRGPRNEGGTFAERMGYHQPRPPSTEWKALNPITDGIGTAGVGFFTTDFELNVPKGYDIPMNFIFFNNTIREDDQRIRHYRVQLFVNGYQFGKYSKYHDSLFLLVCD